jgi:cold shock CspA family protein
MRHCGKLKVWKERGFGFLQSQSLADDLFVHVSEFQAANIEPEEDQIYSFLGSASWCCNCE